MRESIIHRLPTGECPSYREKRKRQGWKRGHVGQSMDEKRVGFSRSLLQAEKSSLGSLREGFSSYVIPKGAFVKIKVKGKHTFFPAGKAWQKQFKKKRTLKTVTKWLHPLQK